MLSPRRLVAILALALVVPVVRAEADPHLPADTSTYISINTRQIIDSPLFKKQLLGPARDALKDLENVEGILKDLGFDPFRHLDRVILATPESSESDRGLLIAYGTYDLEKFRTKAEDAARDNADVLKIHKVPLGGGATHIVYEVIVPNQDMSIFVALANNRTLLASPGKDYVVDALKAVREKRKPALKNKDLQTLIDRLDPKLGVSMAVLGKSLASAARGSDVVPKGIADALAKIEAIGGGFSVTNEVRMDVLVASKDERSAQSIRESIDRVVKLALVGLAFVGEDRKELALLLEVVKTVRITSKGKVVSISARLTADVLDDFFKKGE